MDLFVSNLPRFAPMTKRASAQLSEDPVKWSQEILNELFKTIPEAGQYTPMVSMMEVDDEQGYGLGVIKIRGSTNTSMTTSTEPANVGRVVLVPVIVRQHMLLPLDIMLCDKQVMPLNAVRLREGMFKPEQFDMMTSDWGDTTLYNLFYPPGRSSNDVMSGVGVTSTGSASNYALGPGMKYAMLDKIAMTLTSRDLEKIAGVLQSDSGVIECMKSNELFAGAMRKLAELDGKLLDNTDALYKTAEQTASVHVAQFGFDESTQKYWVKQASRNFYYATEPRYMDRKEFLKIAGDELTSKVDAEGTTTIAHAVEHEPLSDRAKWEVVSEPGVYKVMTAAGKELVGWVIPSLIDFDGTRLPMAVFTNGSTAMVQDQIAGSRVATGVNLPSSEPGGTGVFYMAGEGGIEATIPVEVHGTEASMDGGTGFVIQTLMGDHHRMKMVKGLKAMVPGDSEVLIPDTAKFLSLDKEQAVELLRTPDMTDKTAAALLEPMAVLSHDGIDYRLELSNAPNLERTTSKVAGHDTTVFTLCAAGIDPRGAESFMKMARQQTVRFRVTDVQKLAADIVTEARKTAARLVQQTQGLRQDLVKEAAVLPDIQTVDSVLSLSFINPENIRTFVQYIPYLERALSKVCELVIAARLGFNEIPENASARAVRGLDDVIQGLKALALRSIDEDSPI